MLVRVNQNDVYVIISVYLLSRDHRSEGEVRLRGWRAPETADPVQQSPLCMHQNRCDDVRVALPETITQCISIAFLQDE